MRTTGNEDAGVLVAMDAITSDRLGALADRLGKPAARIASELLRDLLDSPDFWESVNDPIGAAPQH
jgi:hypothetical protein